jgi:PAT family beta-lactamase induction signal transducer AmpG
LTAIGRVYIGPIAGLLVKTLGWQGFYLFSSSLAIPGILLILFLKRHIIIHDNRKASLAL